MDTKHKPRLNRQKNILSVGPIDLGGFWPHMAFHLGGIWPGWPKPGGFWPGGRLTVYRLAHTGNTAAGANPIIFPHPPLFTTTVSTYYYCFWLCITWNCTNTVSTKSMPNVFFLTITCYCYNRLLLAKTRELRQKLFSVYSKHIIGLYC